MPSFIFNDLLQSYSPGPGVPSGFQTQGIVFGSNFIDTSVGPPPSPAPGYYEKTGIIYSLFGNISFPLNTLVSGYLTNATTVWWSTLGNGGITFGPGMLSLSNTNPSTFSQIAILTIAVESDGSISGYVTGGTTVNSLIQNWYPNTWQLFQVDASFAPYISGGQAFIQVTYSVAVNGVVVINNAIILSSILVSATGSNSAEINQWNFSGPANGQFYSEFAATLTNETIPSYPNPAATIHSFTSQLIVELMKVPPRSARASQLIIELMKLPSSRNARVSQIIVELIRQKSKSGGWLTWEA